jgi:chorismate mutase
MLKPAVELKEGEKALILGPCSAESFQQLHDFAERLQTVKPHLIRAGIWKPRTRPGHFQGMGAIAIPWLVDLKREFGYKICTEVANSQHVEQVLKAGFDAIWLGARTTVNPFYVQDIVDALKVDIPVLIKNPLNPDLYLWMGAIERCLKAGLHRIAAIHRGFSFYGNSVYRNIPRWQIPIELKRRMPELQMLVDISHISGTPSNLLEIAQIGFDLNYDGIMVEVHPDPQNALSDSDQQVTPEFLKAEILDKLIKRDVKTDDTRFNSQVTELRSRIDLIDEEIVDLISKRMQLVETIGFEKEQNMISIFQPERWDEIIKRLIEIGKQKNLSEEFIFSLIEAIHIESIHHQSKKMNKLG